jgi:asparagine synthase (glutamine-hydrolysing)
MTVSTRPIHRVENLVPDTAQQIRNLSVDEARARLLEDDATSVGDIEGSFALVARDGERVLLARSLDRPLRYFLAKEAAGPLLVLADRMDAIKDFLESQGYADQFHPTYTRMVPAHHVMEIRLVGCPDPNPKYHRFFDPPRATLPADIDAIGKHYVEALRTEVGLWLDFIPERAPIGVLFSGGIDSGAVLVALHDTLLARGESAARLKAFTLAADGGGSDAAQAREFLTRTGLAFLGEEIEVDATDIDADAAVSVIEDYKPLDVECAAVNLALLRAIRDRYPDWHYLMDGDGGDENLKDYPIEANPELTIRSVVNNRMLYQEGWGVDAIKHSLTYSGGQSRGCVRGYAPATYLGFTTFSPHTAPRVIAVAEAIPFAEITAGSHDKLYELKGNVIARGIRQVFDRDFPIFPKQRFQHGAVSATVLAERLSETEEHYRDVFLALHQQA